MKKQNTVKKLLPVLLSVLLVAFGDGCHKTPPNNNAELKRQLGKAANLPAEEKYKLFQAAFKSNDADYGERVRSALNVDVDENGQTSSQHVDMKFHEGFNAWEKQNKSFDDEVGNETKAREYIDEHLPK